MAPPPSHPDAPVSRGKQWPREGRQAAKHRTQDERVEGHFIRRWRTWGQHRCGGKTRSSSSRGRSSAALARLLAPVKIRQARRRMRGGGVLLMLRCGGQRGLRIRPRGTASQAGRVVRCHHAATPWDHAMRSAAGCAVSNPGQQPTFQQGRGQLPVAFAHGLIGFFPQLSSAHTPAHFAAPAQRAAEPTRAHVNRLPCQAVGRCTRGTRRKGSM
jgi:hypothetical protein